jgi:hypothetical protein
MKSIYSYSTVYGTGGIFLKGQAHEKVCEIMTWYVSFGSPTVFKATIFRTVGHSCKIGLSDLEDIVAARGMYKFFVKLSL